MQTVRRLPVVCQQAAWGPQNPNLQGRLRQRYEAVSRQKQEKRSQEYREWEQQAAAEAAQRRQEAAEEFRQRQVDADGRRTSALDAYRAAAQQAAQGEQQLIGALDEIRVGVQARVRRRQRTQGNVVPEAYGEAVVQQQQSRAQQVQQAAAQLGAGTPPPQPATTSAPAFSSSSAWEAFAASQVAGKFGRVAQMVNAVSRSHEGKDPYRQRRPSTRQAAAAATAVTAEAEQQVSWRGEVQQPQQTWQQPAARAGLVRVEWAEEAAGPAGAPAYEQSSSFSGNSSSDPAESVRTAWADETAASAASAAAPGWVPAAAYEQQREQQQGPVYDNGSGPEARGSWGWAELQSPVSSQTWSGQEAAFFPAVGPFPAGSSQANTGAAAVAMGTAAEVAVAAGGPGRWDGASFGYGAIGTAAVYGGARVEAAVEEEGARAAVVEVEGQVVARSPAPQAAASGGAPNQLPANWGGGAGPGVLQSSEYMDW